MVTLTWILVTFLPKFENCPQGYVGPGGKHDHGAYQNCTGGKKNEKKTKKEEFIDEFSSIY